MTTFQGAGTSTQGVRAYGDPNFKILAATREFIDTASGQPFYGTLENSIQFDRSAITSNGFGEVTLGWGEITLINADGGYDYLIGNYSNVGRPLVIKVGEGGEDPDYPAFYTVFDGLAVGSQVQGRVVRVFVRDNTYKLEQPAQPNVYGSSFGVLAGKRIPRAFGYCQNVTPTLIDPANLIFQVNDGPIEDVVSVKSAGVPLTRSLEQDYASRAALSAATIPSLRYATCFAEGLFRINSTLEGTTITADVQGDKAGGVYVVTTADIVKRLCLSSPYVAASSFDTASFTRMNTAEPGEVCYYLDSESNETIADVVAKLTRGVGGYAGFRRDGLMDIGVISAPSGTPCARYEQIDVKDVDLAQPPSGIWPPPHRYRVAFARNWTVMSQTDIAGSAIIGAAGAGTLQFLTNPYSLESSSTSDQTEIKIKYQGAQDPDPVEAFYTSFGNAATKAQQLLDLYGGLTPFSVYQITLMHRQFVHDINDVIFIDYPRYDLVGGKLIRLVSVSEKAETGETVIVGFG